MDMKQIILMLALALATLPMAGQSKFEEKAEKLGDLQRMKNAERQPATLQAPVAVDTQGLDINVVMPEGHTFTIKGVSFTMLPVAGGVFTMGATAEQEALAADDERPAHIVGVSSFLIGETEVTQELYKAVMGKNPTHYKGEQMPVANVTWDDCQAFISKLNELTGEHFRLPTEAEWEYAARGGNLSRGCKFAGSNYVDDVAWNEASGKSKPQPVKQLKPNEVGAYDMSGNVNEWCADWYGSYGDAPIANPIGTAYGPGRVLRGGNFRDPGAKCRVSKRDSQPGDKEFRNVGFRLAM